MYPFAVVEDPRYCDHCEPAGHPEAATRLAAVGRAIAERATNCARLTPRPAEAEEILRVHTRAHWENVADAARRAPLQLDADTYVSPQSLAVARLAAGGSIDLALAVARGEYRAGFAALRPPGHHAEAGRAMGFCLFNNVAIAAKALQAEAGAEKLLILDWDVHHGNGTQHAFEADPSVLYFSTHQFPYYPGSGNFDEIGTGKGEGATVNVPLPAGCGDAVYLGIFQRVLAPIVLQYRPQFILVSCGFDAHRADPLAGMQLTRDGFAAMARCVRALADEVCGGRVVFLLEGGYSALGLWEGTAAVVDAMREMPLPVPEPQPQRTPGDLLDRLLTRVAGAHRHYYTGLCQS